MYGEISIPLEFQFLGCGSSLSVLKSMIFNMGNYI